MAAITETYVSEKFSLRPLQGLLGESHGWHLLNRSVFGARKSEIGYIAQKTAEEALDTLLQESVSELSPPLGVKDTDTEVPVGTPWINVKYNSQFRSQRLYSLNSWWMGRLINQDLSLREKMALFWHNHFVIENDVVNNVNFNYQYNLLLYQESLGNFRTLTEKMTINTGMLQYLNGVDNSSGSPNENYARELFELFTIGKGPLTEPGNYTNYTEQDIREAARVLTGWRTNSNTGQSWFDANRHDKGEKVFSDFYENRVITNQNETEYKELIEMIFGKMETARFLVRKLYRWFVYYHIDEETDIQVIEPLAALFFQNGFELKPLLKALLCSEHFFYSGFRGCMIKNPLDFSVGMLRQLEFRDPEDNQLIAQYGIWNWIHSQSIVQDMNPGNPPDVAGWPAWYLEPAYNRLWINSATLPARANFVKAILETGVRPASGFEKLYIDPFAVVYLSDNPSDVNQLLNTLITLLMPVPVTSAQLAGLKETLIPGLPDFEWTIEWNKYVNDPQNVNQKSAVANRLINLITRICTMAEFQLI